MEEHQPQYTDRRFRYRLDSQSRAVLDAEIAKLAVHGPLVALTRRQVLRRLVVRAACCKCDAGERELPALGPSVDEPKRRWFVDGDAFVRAVIQTEAQKLADDEGFYVWLNPHQMLRMLLLRAARCRCERAAQSS